MRLLSLVLVRVAKVFVVLSLRFRRRAKNSCAFDLQENTAPEVAGDFGMIGAVESSGVARVHGIAARETHGLPDVIN